MLLAGLVLGWAGVPTAAAARETATLQPAARQLTGHAPAAALALHYQEALAPANGLPPFSAPCGVGLPAALVRTLPAGWPQLCYRPALRLPDTTTLPLRAWLRASFSPNAP